jgi:predicted unusual protein kinase regulating ubiquinone biosynthesis (AarF/ABC1/UbiB family)
VARRDDLPTGRLARLGRLARVTARSGLSIFAGGDGSAAAQHAAELLGNLRGLAAKAGQMASYVDGMVPDGQRDAYERLLGGLQNATGVSAFPQVRAVIEAELGAPIDRLYAELDPEPIASASIGQVHRGRLHDGQEVAVKIQHPGIERAIEADLASAGSLASFVSLVGPKGVDVHAIHLDVAQRFREELDYRLEAERQGRFASFYVNEPHIHVPRVIASHSATRVLTSELVRGQSFTDAVAAPKQLREHYARVLWRFVFKAVLVEGVLNADPHPGNYIFHEDGRISFLDFGCVQELQAGHHAAARGMHEGAVSRDEAKFRAAAARASETVPGPYESDLLDYLWRCFEPLQHSPYHMQRAYVADLVRSTQDLKKHLLGKKSKMTPPPSGMVLVNRLQFGFYSVLARLDVAVDYAALDRELLSLPTRDMV